MSIVLQRLTDFLTDALSLKVVEGAATQQLFAALDTEIDAGVAALETATTASAMAAAEREYGHVFRTFGSDGLNFSQEFRSLAHVFEGTGYVLAALGAAPPGALTDFQAFGAQLHATDHDFRHFGDDMNLLGSLRTPGALPGAVGKAADVTTALSADFSALSGQATALAGVLNPPGATAAPTAALGRALTPLGGEFAALAADFANFSTLLGGHPAIVPGSVATNPLTFDGVFASLDTDFIALDASLQGAASPIAQLLVPPASAHRW